ncbi:glutathione S-transferase family protein [Sphingomonas sp. MMS24-JH45]
MRAKERMSMLTVHHLGLSQSERIDLAVRGAGARIYAQALRPPVRQPPRPRRLQGAASDGHRPRHHRRRPGAGESGAICDYINVKHGGGRLAPAPDDPDFADHLFWFHWSNGTYMATKMIAGVLGYAGSSPAAVPFVQARVDASRDLVERRLGEAPFFGGQALTLADIMMVYAMTTSLRRQTARRHAQRASLSPPHRRAPGVPGGDGEGGTGDDPDDRLIACRPGPDPGPAAFLHSAKKRDPGSSPA